MHAPFPETRNFSIICHLNAVDDVDENDISGDDVQQQRRLRVNTAELIFGRI